MSTQGVDLSHWNGSINWAALKADGVPFALHKVNEGGTTGGRDPNYPAARAGALAEGVPFGGYHFARPGDDPQDSAILFGAYLGQTAGMLPAFLDMEDSAGLGPAALDAWMAAWFAKYRHPAGVYTAFEWWNSNLGHLVAGDLSLANRPLWLARYAATMGPIPQPWTEVAIWQDTDRNTLPGIAGAIDGDVLVSETVPQLVAFGAGLQLKPPEGLPVTTPINVDATIKRINQLAGGGELDLLIRRFLTIQRDVYGGQSQTQNLAALKADADKLVAGLSQPAHAAVDNPPDDGAAMRAAEAAAAGPSTPAVTVAPVEPTQGV